MRVFKKEIIRKKFTKYSLVETNITNIIIVGIKKATLRKVTNNMRNKAQLYINANGGLFEHQL